MMLRQTCSHSVSLTSPKFLTSPHPIRYATGSVRQQKSSVRGLIQTTLQHPLSLKHKEPFWSKTTRFDLYFLTLSALFPEVADQTWSQEAGNPAFPMIPAFSLKLRKMYGANSWLKQTAFYPKTQKCKCWIKCIVFNITTTFRYV